MNVLAVVAHPDDEILGIGGTLAKHVLDGDTVFCLILGEGATSRDNGDSTQVKALHENTKRAGKCIGFEKIFLSNLPDNCFDGIELLKIIKIVEKHISLLNPELIYTHHLGDLNIDHKITFNAVLTASRPQGNNPVKKLITFETPSSTEWNPCRETAFVPNIYVDISKTIQLKLDAMKEYKTEIRSYPHPRSLEGLEILAKKRGMECGLQCAEALCLIRKII